MSNQWAAVPEELKARRQWCVWRYEHVDGRDTKVPYRPRATVEQRASSTNPATWGDFGDAVTVAELKGYDGIGYMMSEDDPFVGIDLDHCVGHSGVEDWAANIAACIDSYTEVTPSGEGLRIFVKALWPGRDERLGRRKGGIEIYAGKRFLTVTGQVPESFPFYIEERTGELAKLFRELFPDPIPFRSRQTTTGGMTDEEVIAKAQTASNADKFRALWAGNKEGYDSPSEADLALLSILAFYTQDIDQLERLFARSGLYREKWRTRADYRANTLAKALGGLSDTYNIAPTLRTRNVYASHVQQATGTGDGTAARETRQNGQSAAPPQPPPDTSFNLTDLGNAQRLVARHGVNMRYCHLWAKWLVWDGRRWSLDNSAAVTRLAKETVRSIYEQAARVENDDERKALVSHARKSEAEARIRAMISLAESEPGVPVAPEQLDADPWLLNVLNGTLDLRSGELRAHGREDMLTRMVAVEYDPEAECPEWLRFLNRVMMERAGVISFLQRAVGYSLTGSTRERVLFFLYGTGKNGKTTFVETLRALLGDYSLRTPTETLMVKREGGIPNDVARLKGARLVTAAEAEEGKRLAESLVKDLTGGDVISARFMRGEFFDFKPECKIWFSTNHKPVIRGTDKGIWDRIKLVPFEVRIPDQERDERLGEKLLGELFGILAWAVQGCLMWQRSGLGVPAEVANATEVYRAEMDVLAGFLDDCCVIGPACKVTSKDLYQAYSKWCETTGERPLSQKSLSMRLGERGFIPARDESGSKRLWRGIGLREEFLTRSDGS